VSEGELATVSGTGDSIAAMPGINLDVQIATVREARIAFNAENGLLTALRAAFDKSNAEIIERVANLKKKMAEEEERLRDLTLAVYDVTGDKKPAPGVGIRVVQKVEFDEDKALVWAKDHRVCLSLNEKAFKALAKTQWDPTMPCKVVETPQATISDNL
jgi:hypothetical protein